MYPEKLCFVCLTLCLELCQLFYSQFFGRFEFLWLQATSHLSCARLWCNKSAILMRPLLLLLVFQKDSVLIVLNAYEMTVLLIMYRGTTGLDNPKIIIY